MVKDIELGLFSFEECCITDVLTKAKSGDVVEVLATDPSTSWDIPKFCMHLGHELLLKEEVLDEQNHKEYRYLVQKG